MWPESASRISALQHSQAAASSAADGDGNMAGTSVEFTFPLPTAFAVPLSAAPPIIDVAGQLERVAELNAKGDLDDDEWSDVVRSDGH